MQEKNGEYNAGFRKRIRKSGAAEAVPALGWSNRNWTYIPLDIMGINPHNARNAPKMVQPLNHAALYNPNPAIRKMIPKTNTIQVHFPQRCIPHIPS